jgi:hypothetical protein
MRLGASVAALIGLCIPGILVVVLMGVLCLVAGLRRLVVCRGKVSGGRGVRGRAYCCRDRCGGRP